MSLPTYKDLKWRIDAQIASRTLRQTVEPTVVLQIDTLDENSGKLRPSRSRSLHSPLIRSRALRIVESASVVLQTDPTTLVHLTEQLEAALKAVKMSHYRRITRAIK